MTVQTTQTQALNFDRFASEIVKGYKTFDKAQSKLSQTVATQMQQFVDHVAVTLGRDEKACKALQAAIRDSQIVIDADAAGYMNKKTFTEYAQSAARALHYNVPFEPTLKNNSEMKLPWGKSGNAQGSPKSGQVISTTHAEFHKTLCKALAQARALTLTGFAADMLDLCLDRLDGFEETVLK